MQFTDDEIETIKDIIIDWGSDCPNADSDKVKELEYKLGLAVRPTAEEIAEQEKRRKEFAETPYGKQMAELFKMANNLMPDVYKTPSILVGSEKIGSTLRIILPTDYQVKKD